MLQSGSCTLADVIYTKARHFEQRVRARDPNAIKAVEEIWAQLEQPLLLLAFWFYPSYKAYVDNLNVTEFEIERFVMEYAKRWGL